MGTRNEILKTKSKEDETTENNTTGQTQTDVEGKESSINDNVVGETTKTKLPKKLKRGLKSKYKIVKAV